ncbi:MAG TPA: ferritin-like domain-containing protein [Micromonosporaceae bacterium]|nr:ferritin-like domain-containing protein [Micromonosporaceae bacterium]
MTTLDNALDAALDGEHAAIYAYGVVGPRLMGTARAMALQHEAVHRAQRDSMLETMASAPTGQAIYSLPFAVTDARSAIALAVEVEARCAQLWRAVVAASESSGRPAPLTVLTNAALRAAALRRIGGAVPGTVAFPGLTS